MILDLLGQNVVAIDLDIGLQGMITFWETFKHLPFIHRFIDDTTAIRKMVPEALKTSQIFRDRLGIGIHACIGKFATC